MRTLIICLVLFLVWVSGTQAQSTQLGDYNHDDQATLSNCAEDWPDTWRKHEVCTDYQIYAWSDSVNLTTRSSLQNWNTGSFNFSGTLKYVVPPPQELAFDLIVINPEGDTVYNRTAYYQIIEENWSFSIGFLQYVYTDENIILINPLPGLYTLKSIIKASQFTNHEVVLNFSIDSPVPVELSNFTATIINHIVKLSWTTATEVNNYGFVVERQSFNRPYANIGFVPSQGNGSSPRAYYFIDRPNLPDKYLYRLKQLDLNGGFQYSDAVGILFKPDLDFELHQNYPNPFNPATVISYSLPQPVLVHLAIYNVLGQEIMTLKHDYQSAGTYQISFMAPELSAGIYFYRLTAGNFNQTKQMIILK